jgi:hypothetical protein
VNWNVHCREIPIGRCCCCSVLEVNREESWWGTERDKAMACKSGRITVLPRLPMDGKEVRHPKRDTVDKNSDGRQETAASFDELTREGRKNVDTKEDRPRAEDKINRDKCLS